MVERKVLVLNQNYEPFTICSAKRAIVLLYLHKVQLVEKYDGFVRSVNTRMPLPSVVRLNRYIRKPFREINLNRKNILRRDRHICQYCGKNSKPMTVDHIIPKSYGGDDSWENLVTACLACNNRKADRTPEEANMKLIRKPVKPGYLFYLQSLIRRPHHTWRPYLFMGK